jgi:hypothetical protein
MAIDYTFGGKVSWDITLQSWETDTIASKLQKSIEDALELADDEKSIIEEYCVFLSCTRGVYPHINGTRPGATLVEFMAVLSDLDRLTPNDLWSFRKRAPNALVGAWRAAFLAAQELFVLDAGQLPDENLTPAQQEEVKDINSPLVSAAPNSA